MKNILNREPIFRTSDEKGKHHFFGYYDKCPWSKNERFLLTLETDLIDRLPTEEDVASVGIIDLEGDKKFKKLAETRAWNFQQGCMLQWLGPDFNERIIFNDFRNNRFVSVIFNIKTDKEEKEIPFPIYAVHPSGEFALSVDFSLLNKMREGYGYKGRAINPGEGIYSINLENNEKNNIAFLDVGQSWVDHITFNPSGNKFAFLHRFKLKSGGFFSQFCVASADHKTIDIKNSVLLTSGMASHFVWKNDKEILIWARPPGTPAKVGKNKFIKKLILPVYHAFVHSADLRQKISGDGFLLFNIESRNFEKVGNGILIEDGHASFSPDKSRLLTDTYAGRNKMRKLFLFNLLSKKLTEVRSFYALPDKKFQVKGDWDSSNLRCDLHPRWNRDGTQVCIDSVHEGIRQIYVFDVSDILNEHGKN